MMTEISLNVLDVSENSTRAGATLVAITIEAQTAADTLTITIEDNGCGMSPEQAASVTDPFFTTRTTRKVGLGIPFFQICCGKHWGKLFHSVGSWKRDYSHSSFRPVPY